MPPDLSKPEPGPSDEGKHNFWTMVGYQIALRTGWIFKTESVIMPSFLDHLGGPSWVRGLLPIFNRFGQSIPPMLASDWLNRQPRKKSVVATTTFAMGCCFLILASVYWLAQNGNATATWMMPGLFVAIYAIFFSCFGVNQLAQNTLQGKVIPVRRRGSLMGWSSLLGVLVAVTGATVLLPYWLNQQQAQFQWVFGITGSTFLLASILATLFHESADPTEKQRGPWYPSLLSPFQMAAVVVRQPDFRLLGTAAGTFGLQMVLFPHYQALFRSTMEMDYGWLMHWLVAQNIGAAFFSLVTGRIADRIGNVLAIRLMLLLQTTIPLLALASCWLFPTWKWMTMVAFFLLGSTPVTFRLFSNLTLELVPRKHHPRYLSSLAICLSVPPMILSGPVGLLVDQLGFAPIFLAVALMLLGSLVAMLGVSDPRNRTEIREDTGLSG